MPFAPEWTGNTGAGYTFTISGEGTDGNPITKTPRIDIAYRGDSFARLFQNPATELEGYTLVHRYRLWRPAAVVWSEADPLLLSGSGPSLQDTPRLVVIPAAEQIEVVQQVV